eukprot:4287619-Amphidinium_carterae.1
MEAMGDEEDDDDDRQPTRTVINYHGKVPIDKYVAGIDVNTALQQLRYNKSSDGDTNDSERTTRQKPTTV